MIIERPHWEKDLSIELLRVGSDTSLVRVLEPAEDSGITYLRLGDEMWVSVPAIERKIRFEPSMLSQPWMGSDFTNDDMTRGPALMEGQRHELGGTEEVEGERAYRIETHLPERAITEWTRIVRWIRVEDDLPLRAEYYTERGEIVRSVTLRWNAPPDGDALPVRVEISDLQQSGGRSVVELDSVTFDVAMPDSLFSVESLRSGGS